MAGGSEAGGSVTREAGDLAVVEIVVARLAGIEAGQNAMNGALGLMLDTLQAQTNLLRKLNEYASEEAAPSPVAKILGELTAAIMELDASIGGMEKKFGRLSDVIAAAYDLDLAGKPTPAVNGKA